jgi:acetoin utilization protein AcuB
MRDLVATSVRLIMTPHAVTVTPDTSLRSVRAIFAQHRFHHLLVVEDGRLVGVVSDRDLLKAISPNLGTLAETARDEATLAKHAHQVMSRKLATLNVRATTGDAIDLFNGRQVSCIPVVDDDFHPVGIISWRDVLRALSPVSPGESPHAGAATSP